MNENDVIKIVKDFVSKKFPRDCPCCKKHYPSLAEYIRNTTHAGRPVSYDADNKDWKPEKPLGTISMANCSCGSTMIVDSSGMGLLTIWKLLNWVKKETKARGISTGELLEEMRKKIGQSVLQDENDLGAER